MQKYAQWLVASMLLSMVANVPAAEMATAIEATGPHPSLGDQAKVLSRLVGSWDVEYTDFRKDGTTLHRTGEFMVGWIMDGRALQDFWVVDPWENHKVREVYTDIHYFDAKSGTWHATFVDPQDGSVSRFTASEVSDNRLVLDSKEIGSGDTRWSFNDMQPDSFVYRDEGSSDGGKTWTLRAEYHMKRHGVHSKKGLSFLQ